VSGRPEQKHRFTADTAVFTTVDNRPTRPRGRHRKKSGDDANQDCHHGLGVLSTGTTIGLAAVVITVVPVLIIYLIFQRQLQGSVSAGTNK
jgi:hypothetical protein